MINDHTSSSANSELVVVVALPDPQLVSRLVQPRRQAVPDVDSFLANHAAYRLLLGTHTSQHARPGADLEKVDQALYDNDCSGAIPPAPRIQIVQRIIDHKEAVSGQVLVFVRTKHGSEADRDGKRKPQIRLFGQTQEGFGLAWSPVKEGHILEASEDTTVCHWDITSYASKDASIQPTTTFVGHTAVVKYVDWHTKQENMLASVGDDKMLMIWDTCAATQPPHKYEAREREILSVTFSPAKEDPLITGSTHEGLVFELTTSASREPPHTFAYHTDEVVNLAWSPHNATAVASAASDRAREHLDGAPELLLIHGGYTAHPTIFCGVAKRACASRRARSREPALS
ncbi:WD40 repeat-like protein [Mycena kentingensis (nom. inval.)]|nr:WD40 repeat-like protein [Mycena kentingensis (nom. inval.)]